MMRLPSPFKLERYFAQYEFSVRYLLSASDCESLSLRELLALADDETRALWESLGLGYTESPGHPLLRAEIARQYKSLRAEEVMACVPEEGIFLAMHTLLEPGDHVVALTPSYQSLTELARAIGCEVTAWTLTVQGDGWTLDLEQLRRALTSRTKLLVLNFPNNPTGYLPTRAEFDAILGLAREQGVFVFSDEMYRGLEHDGAQRLPSAADVYPRGIALSGLSKSFALPGLRMGWLATRAPGLVERWLTLKDYTTICHSAPSEMLALMALRARETILTRNLEIIRANRAHAEAFCAEHPALFRWLAPQAGSIAFPEWRGAQAMDDFCEAVVTRRGVMIVPASKFDFAGAHFRIGLGRRNLPEALAEVSAFIREQG
jgi:aspartate/methionine/tyrosine aminotransferase